MYQIPSPFPHSTRFTASANTTLVLACDCLTTNHRDWNRTCSSCNLNTYRNTHRHTHSVTRTSSTVHYHHIKIWLASKQHRANTNSLKSLLRPDLQRPTAVTGRGFERIGNAKAVESGQEKAHCCPLFPECSGHSQVPDVASSHTVEACCKVGHIVVCDVTSLEVTSEASR